MQRLEVNVNQQIRPSLADPALVGNAQVGDEIVVNVQALDLELGSGGFDVVHVNLTRGLDSHGTIDAHVMKLNYTSLQHAVLPVEGKKLDLPLKKPVAVCALHGQLAPVAWAFSKNSQRNRIGYVQTEGGALPGKLSRVVGELCAQELLAGHITAGSTYGGDLEAITVGGAIDHGLRQLGWDAAVCGPGPGILGSGSTLGHGGLVALDTAHVALALGCKTILVARMSDSDKRHRHRGLSHHTGTVLDLLLGEVSVGVPVGQSLPSSPRHSWHLFDVDLAGYRRSGLPTETMGRTLDEDPLFFKSALAGGKLLAQVV